MSEGLRWNALGASVRGSSHEALGTPCQDAHAIDHPRPGWIVLAVADGAGSAAHSEAGANIAVQHVISAINAALSEHALSLAELRAVLPSVVAGARDAVVAEARARAVSEHELASTLLVAVSSPSFSVSAHVGDGAVIIAYPDGTVATCSPPEPSEHPNETTFLTSRGALDAVRVHVQEPGPVRIALISDGLQNIALHYPAWDPFVPFFDPLFKFVGEVTDERKATEELRSLLGSKRVRAKSDDDVTLVVAGRPDMIPAGNAAVQANDPKAE